MQYNVIHAPTFICHIIINAGWKRSRIINILFDIVIKLRFLCTKLKKGNQFTDDQNSEGKNGDLPD